MPHSRSAKKRMRQGRESHVRNVSVKSRTRTLRRRFHAAIEEGDVDQARERLREAQKAYDQASAKKVIHRNNAARKVARMTRQLEDLKAGKV